MRGERSEEGARKHTHRAEKHDACSLQTHNSGPDSVSVGGGFSMSGMARSRDRIRKHVHVFAHVPWADPSGSGSHLLVPCEPRG